jgi:hypothetical protein
VFACAAVSKQEGFVRFLRHLFGVILGRSAGLSEPRAVQVRGQPMRPRGFGPFEVMFSGDRPSGAYLSFLGMGTPHARRALTTLSEVLRSTDDAHRYIELMLQGRNWRPHLVASVAILMSPDRAGYTSALWRTFDYGSWVAPQLAVVLYFSDPEFGREAKHRIASRCPLTAAPDLPAQVERTVRSKNIASLLRVVSLLPSETDWVALELAHVDVRELIKADSDSSGEIVDWWLEAAQTQFAKFGCDLDPARFENQ